MKMQKRRGSALVMTVIMMSFLLTLALTLSQLSVAEMRHSDSQAIGEKAHNIAESGLGFMTFIFRGSYLSPSTNASNVLSLLSTELTDQLKDQGEMAGTLSVVGSTVSVPAIFLGGGSFTTTLTYTGSDPMELQMQVTGTFDGTSRTVQKIFRGRTVTSGVFQYGIATPGSVSVDGSALMAGFTPDQDWAATILSCSEEVIAIEVGGSAEITGDLFVTGVDNINLAAGGLSVGGETDAQTILDNHCHFSVDPPEWPEINIQPFIDSMTSSQTITPSTPTNNYPEELTNVIIEAGTNPTISSSVINGVLYIKSPNKVKFSGNVVINGVIITEEKEGESLENCVVEFVGNCDFPGVGALPDTATSTSTDPDGTVTVTTTDYTALKALTGTIALAPGFRIDFSGTSNTASGIMAADQFAFTGNSELSGDMFGTVLGLTDAPLILTGSTELRFNRPDDSDDPAGFRHPIQFLPVLGSYKDIAQ
jgi:hypothetical protein